MSDPPPPLLSSPLLVLLLSLNSLTSPGVCTTAAGPVDVEGGRHARGPPELLLAVDHEGRIRRARPFDCPERLPRLDGELGA